MYIVGSVLNMSGDMIGLFCLRDLALKANMVEWLTIIFPQQKMKIREHIILMSSRMSTSPMAFPYCFRFGGFLK